MPPHYDKSIIHPAHATGHDCDEFMAALERWDLEKSGQPKTGWTQILHPRTTLLAVKR